MDLEDDLEDWEIQAILDELIGLDRAQTEIDKISNEITFSDLIVPVSPAVDISAMNFEEYQQTWELSEHITPLYDRQKLIGHVHWEDLDPYASDHEHSFEGICREYKEVEKISADKSFVDLVEVLDSREADWLIVVDAKNIIGIVYEEAVRKAPIFKIVVLCLIFRFENLALEICKTNAPRFWDFLNEPRKQKAQEIFNDDANRGYVKQEKSRRILAQSEKITSVDFGGKSFKALLARTTFSDKKTMILKSKVFDTQQANTLKKLFDEIESVRNILVHPGRDVHSDKLNAKLVSDLRTGIGILKNFLN